jgi:hypothetical protein
LKVDTSTLNISGSVFQNLQFDKGGYFIDIQRSKDVIITSSIFTNYTATFINLRSTNVKIKNSTFTSKFYGSDGVNITTLAKSTRACEAYYSTLEI